MTAGNFDEGVDVVAPPIVVADDEARVAFATTGAFVKSNNAVFGMGVKAKKFLLVFAEGVSLFRED